MKCWKKLGECEALRWTGLNVNEIVSFLLPLPGLVPTQLVVPNQSVDFGYRGMSYVLFVGDWLVLEECGLQIYSDQQFHETFTLTTPTLPTDVASAVNKTPVPSFMDDLTTVLNRHSAENDSNTPDFILAEFLNNCLAAWNKALQAREDWYNVYCTPSKPLCDSDHRPVSVRNVP